MTSKRTPDSVRREHLRKELSELRLRTIPAVDMSTGGFVPLAIPGLRSISLDRSPGQSVFAALRALIADAIDGVGVIVGMEDRAAGAARILFGLDDQPPLDRRRRAAELYDAERYITAQGKFGKSESDKWRQYGEREVLDQLAAHIELVRDIAHEPTADTAIDETDARRRAAFITARKTAAVHVKDLIAGSIALHDSHRFDRSLPLLTRTGWIPPAPIPLSDVRLDYVAQVDETTLREARRQLTDYWPSTAGRPFLRYSSAVACFDRPRYFFDGTSYRLLHVEPGGGRPRLTLTGSQYWDHYDTSEPLLFEAAWGFERSFDNEIDGPYRRWMRDPFDFTRRSAIPGVNTLTIRRSSSGSMFYLVHRGDVGTAMGTMHVIPAGEFQPSRDIPRPAGGCWPDAAMRSELNIDATMVREYVEEILDHEEARSPELPPIDVSADEPYRRIHQALTNGEASAWYLGIGLYPLTWKPEILTVCVFPDYIFDSLFAKMVKKGAEGELVGADHRIQATSIQYEVRNRPYEGLPFTERIVGYYAEHPRSLSAARACLKLAWRHRAQLGLGS